jgi:uncharacterized RDD family membrane protein YckC
MACAGCGIAFEGEYCPDCGTPAGLRVPAKRDGSLIGLRCAGYLIDAIAVAAISFGLSWLPLANAFLLSVAFVPAWWLFRDIGGASPGKLLLGLRVVRQDGTPSGVRERILRNTTLLPGPLLALFPIAGLFAGPAVAICLTLVEMAFLLTRHQRLGDRLAGTTVVGR